MKQIKARHSTLMALQSRMCALQHENWHNGCRACCDHEGLCAFFCTTCVLLKSIIYLITLNFDMSIKGLMDSFSDADKAAEKLDYEINDVTLTVLYK